jgi:hypothetical protein
VHDPYKAQLPFGKLGQAWQTLHAWPEGLYGRPA